MKTVLSPDMVAHVWAAQSQATGKTSHGNFYFRGASLFSYGSHYVCGFIMPDGAALVNADKHSKTTTKHQYAAWSAVSHRSRFWVPSLNNLSTLLQDFSDAEKGSEYRARYVDKIRAFVADNIRDLQDSAAAYLLALSGSSNPANVAKKMREAAKRADEKAKEKDAADTKRENLERAAHISKLCKSERDLVAGLANVMDNPAKLADNATKLHHAHRAAKAAKRDRQAADCFRVLQLVRAEIKRRADCDARRNANGYKKNQITELRDGLKKLGRAFDGALVFAGARREYGEYDASQLVRAASNIIAFPSVKRAQASLTALVDGLTPCIVEMEETREAREAAKAARELSDWRACVPGASRPYRSYGSAALLRARGVTRDDSGAITGGTLETSQGADVPLLHALRAFRFLKLCKERHAASVAAREAAGDFPIDVIAWERNGHSLRVGHFAIETIWASGNFRAGCHRIDWEEVQSLAASLGVADLGATDEALEVTANAA